MAAGGRRYRLAWFETLLDDCQLLLGCPPPAADITRQQFNMSVLVRHKPIPKPVLEPFCLCRLSGPNGGQFTRQDDQPAEDDLVRNPFVPTVSHRIGWQAEILPGAGAAA